MVLGNFGGDASPPKGSCKATLPVAASRLQTWPGRGLDASTKGLSPGLGATLLTPAPLCLFPGVADYTPHDHEHITANFTQY